MKKRILSIVLAVLMLVGIMPISAIAADAEPPAAQTGVSTKTSENTTGPKLEKSAQWVDEKAGIAKITIQVTGEQPTETTKKTDIVLVIDRSLSMTQNDRDWLKNAKKAAKAFAAKVLTGDPNVRIAVVAYAAKTIDNRDFSSNLKQLSSISMPLTRRTMTGAARTFKPVFTAPASASRALEIETRTSS